MTRKHTKRALFTSALVLLLCLSMLVGTTFAWFTDSATSGSNVITSGNLDIEVQYTLDGKEWKALDGAEDLFEKGLWEPGHTEVVVLKVENKGTLALKYNSNMNIVSETIGKTKDGKDIALSDHLTVSTLTIEAAGADPVLGWDIAAMTLEKAFQSEDAIGWGAPVSFKAGSVLEQDMQLYAGSTHYVFIKVDMPETVGNEANHDGINMPSINFGVNVLATQYTYENDSFGNQYDKDAEYPDLIPVVTDIAGLRAALEEGGEFILGADIVVEKADVLYKADGGHNDGSAFFVKKDTVLDLNGYDITFNSGNSASDMFFMNWGADLTIKGDGNLTADCSMVCVYDANSTLNIEGGNFYVTANNDMLYAIYGKINVSGGTFTTSYWNTINIYGSGRIELVDVTGGKFENWNPAASPDGNLLADGYKSVSEVVDGVTWYTVVAE